MRNAKVVMLGRAKARMKGKNGQAYEIHVSNFSETVDKAETRRPIVAPSRAQAILRALKDASL